MANEENLKPFPPGVSGNPNGRPPEATRELKKYSKQLIAEVVNRLMAISYVEVKTISEQEDAPMIEQTIAKVLLKCHKHGDFSDLDKILDRVIGKVPQKVENEMFGPGGQPLTPPVIHYHPVAPKSDVT